MLNVEEDRVGELRSAGKALVQQHRYQEAVRVYEALLAVDGSLQHQEALARCLEKLGRWGEAAARYQLVVDADHERPDALVGMGLCLLRQDDADGALAAFHRCLNLDPTHLGALLGKATCLRLSGDLEGADAVYRAAIRVQPGIESALDELISKPSKDARVELGETENIIASAVLAEDYATAAEHCRALAELAPDYYEAWFNLGVFEQRNSNPQAAAEAFIKAAEQEPFRAEPFEALAQLYHQTGDLKSAAAGYEEALTLKSDSQGLQWNLGLVLEQQGDFAGAAQKFSRLVKADQDHGEAWFRLALARLRLNDHEGAVVAFRRALDLGARTFESTYNLGLAHWESGRVNQAAECFRAALKMHPDFRPAHRGLAAVALNEGDYARARDLHLELVEAGDASVEILFNLAVCEHRSNRLHSAIEFYKQALKADPEFADASAGLALAQSTLSARRHK